MKRGLFGVAVLAGAIMFQLQGLADQAPTAPPVQPPPTQQQGAAMHILEPRAVNTQHPHSSGSISISTTYAHSSDKMTR